MFLPDSVQTELRKINKIQQNEVLKKEGDLFVAVNVINQQRRIVELDLELLEKINRLAPAGSNLNRRILKG